MMGPWWFLSLRLTGGQRRSWVWLSDPLSREDDRTEWSLLQNTQIRGWVIFLHSTSSCSLTFISHHQDCDFPPDVAHGHYEEVKGFRVFTQNEVIYKCDKGYTLVGEAKLSCSSLGWTPAVPQCKGNSNSLFSQVGGNVTKARKHLIWFDLFEIMTMFRMQTVQGEYININLPSSFSQS